MASNFSCQACGHNFTADPAIIANQPTCPKCRTFGQLVDANGRPVATQRRGAPARRPAGPTPYQPPRGGPVPPNQREVVEVNAAATYGRKNNNTLNLILIGVTGVTIVCALFFAVKVFSADGQEEARKEKEQVLNKEDFATAISKSVDNVRKRLKSNPDFEVQETTDFTSVKEAMFAASGQELPFTTGVQPGKPFKSYGFVVSGLVKGTKKRAHCCLMLLYYTTLEEFKSALNELRSTIGGRNYIGVKAESHLWYIAYYATNYAGSVYDTVKDAAAIGSPSSFNQFQARMGAEFKNK